VKRAVGMEKDEEFKKEVTEMNDGVLLLIREENRIDAIIIHTK
jgi:hypothetical protein